MYVERSGYQIVNKKQLSLRLAFILFPFSGGGGEMKFVFTANALLLCVALAGSSSVQWSTVAKVGADSEGHYWRPKRGVGFSKMKAALTIERKSHNCSCEEPKPDVELATCRTCSKKDTLVFTADGGNTFHEYLGTEVFCGEQGIPTKQEDGDIHHHCPEESKQTSEEDAITIPLSSWRIAEGGLIESAKMHVSQDKGSIKVWTHSIKREQPISIVLGDNVLDMPDKKLMFRLGTVKFSDEEIPVILKSQDSGSSWIFVGRLPNGFGFRNSLERGGENVIRLHFQNETNIYRQVSRTLGRKWENATELPLSGMPKVLHSKFSTVIFGGRTSPFLMTQGAKKGSSQVCLFIYLCNVINNKTKTTQQKQYFSITSEHNTIAGDADDYTEDYVVCSFSLLLCLNHIQNSNKKKNRKVSKTKTVQADVQATLFQLITVAAVE